MFTKINWIKATNQRQENDGWRLVNPKWVKDLKVEPVNKDEFEIKR